MSVLCFSPRSLSSFCRAMVGAVAMVALFVASAGILQAQSLDLASLDALDGPCPLLIAAVAPIDLTSLQELERPLAAAGLDLSSLQELEAVPKPARSAPTPVAAVKPSPPAVFNPLAAEGWGCDAYMPTWCGHCTDMQGAEEPKALATGFPLHCIKGDEQQFPAWVVASANSSQAKGWPLIHVYNRKTGVAVQTWGKRTIEQLAELIEWAKQRPAPPVVAPPQTSLPVQFQQPAAVSPLRCNKRRCLSLYGEDRPAWV